MRIGMMADTYTGYISGVTNYITVHKRELETLGHEVYVFAFSGALQALFPPDPTIVLTPGLSIKGTYYIGAAYSLRAQALLRSMDILHLHHPFVSGMLARRYGKRWNIPVVFTNHTRYDLYMRYYLPWISDNLTNSVMGRRFPQICAHFDRVIAPTPTIESILHSIGVKTPIEMIPNGVDIHTFEHAHAHFTAEDWGFDKNDFIFLYLGRLAPEKNMAFLLRAFAQARQECPTARLLVVGGGPDLEPMKELAQVFDLGSSIHFTGPVPYETVPLYFSAVDAFATASTTEVHPLTVIEAMAAGLPVVGIQSPGVGELVKHGVTGLLDHKDEANFAHLMAFLAQHPADSRHYGQAAHEAAQFYSVRRTAPLILDLYQRVIEERKARQVIG